MKVTFNLLEDLPCSVFVYIMSMYVYERIKQKVEEYREKMRERCNNCIPCE